MMCSRIPCRMQLVSFQTPIESSLGAFEVRSKQPSLALSVQISISVDHHPLTGPLCKRTYLLTPNIFWSKVVSLR